jgi:hypothetical protein
MTRLSLRPIRSLAFSLQAACLAAACILAACGDSRGESPGANRTEAPLGAGVNVRVPSAAAEGDEARKPLLPGEWQSLAERAGMPLLVPADAADRARLHVMGGEVWLAWSLHREDISLSLHGTRTIHGRAERPAPATGSVRGHDAWSGADEGVASVSWSESGAGWMLDAQCESATDTRCSDPQFVAKFADSLLTEDQL